ncbi:ABC transporter substrate-binding protein [candidate division KSB3 bacterium]|uniref:ABC transporter substrate-binding protein n=1 Tax=candidate division KSB3 bacterium TaxID=2044937 RepID=A0A2G6E6N1_9BACT|nr:MAG: ABC transporter substrate-binding protein [candidate division KSB3 bacterium]PIE29981.1 MAG: ABC transporter substrate-binding protein [candidate division KSB3 bacterium]
MKNIKIFVLIVVCLMLSSAAAQAKKLRIGVTLHPYYSFVANIVEDLAEVVPVIPAGANSHGYHPQPEDIKGIMTLDAMVVNGIGHDEFAFEILEAAQMKGKIPLIYANEGVALLPIAGTQGSDRIVNPHTFISISTSIQQIYTISKALMKLDPVNAKAYQRNTRTFTSRLRRMKAKYMQQLSDVPLTDFRCATVHGAYSYLMQEFGLRVEAVIEPRHGLKPTASQLKETIETIASLNVDVIFSEMDFPDKYVGTIQEATGVKLYSLSHITIGPYTKETFENLMQHNIETVITALLEVQTEKNQQ